MSNNNFNEYLDNENKPYVEEAKNCTFRNTKSNIQYCIMRIEGKYYTLESVEGFEYHMERKGQIDNVDSTKSHENRILIGDSNIYENLKQHIEGVWKRRDSPIMRDGLLTGSPDFMRGMSKPDLERWINLNIEWLKNTFSNEIIYAVLHTDESTPHIHFCTSVVYTNDKGKRVMSNKHYFGGKRMLSDLQTNYATHIQTVFKSLNRGLKNSRATHTSIKSYYNLCSKKLDEKNIESIFAKAKNNELVEIQLNNTKKTLLSYKKYQVKEDQEKEIIKQQNFKLFQTLVRYKNTEKVFEQSLKAISNIYKIPESQLTMILEKCKDRVKKEMNLGEELKK
ncbi:plasmid recombination protein [Clostridium estertheticum]|uniref:plasmid recombination protein n=1 Tax=Clostridium estertheticum TaxID=238834 RepID=UPI001C0BC3A5|nr:plasmid recombination protein [Clostridium estertheticum]MBU3173390.1 plasmid recombination protein [Clostridium estertheticum]